MRFIKRAQTLGLTLDEVMVLLSLEGAHTCAETRALARHKQALLEHKLAGLSALHAALGELIRQCDRRRRNAACPIIETLAHDRIDSREVGSSSS